MHANIPKVKGFVEEFRAFAIKGNVIDLAVAVVIGTSFSKIVDSLVNDVIMQAIAMIFGAPNFNSIHFGAIRVGSFINNIVNFLIVALSIFVTIKLVNRFMPRHKEEPLK